MASLVNRHHVGFEAYLASQLTRNHLRGLPLPTLYLNDARMGASVEESGPEKHLQRHELAIVNFINPLNVDLRDIPRILQT